MSSSSVSFRISRHTQDLAETLHALSQRLVTMEQRLQALEQQLVAVRRQPRQAEEAEAVHLAPIEANIERLLLDCRQLLADQPVAEVFEAPEPGQSESGDHRLESDAVPLASCADPDASSDHTTLQAA